MENMRRHGNSAEASRGTSIALEAVATSPELLAQALVKLIGAESAADLLGSALNYISSTSNSMSQDIVRSGWYTESLLHGDGGTTEVSAFAEEEDLSREQLQIIKARTMFNMVEEVNEGKCKLLFLTNPQAELIASSPESVQKMLDALEVPKPSLVIELLQSYGFRGSLTLKAPEAYQDTPLFAGMVGGCPPFLTEEDEQEAETKLDMFMSDIIIPLAASTHAVVICHAVPGNCMLSASFLRMYMVMRSKWSGPPPLTVISYTNDISSFYKNPNENAHWRNVRRSSRAWRQRDPKLLEIYGPKSEDEPSEHYDLDPNASCIIMADCVNPKRDKSDKNPYNALKQALTRHLSTSVPSLAIKTGCSGKDNLGSPLGIALDIVSARAQAGTPVLALDVRKRTPLTLPAGTMGGEAQRASLIIEAKSQIDALREGLLEDKEGKLSLAETFDVCALAYLHEVLESDGGHSNHESRVKMSGASLVPLHEAIRRAKDEDGTAEEGGAIPRATPGQIAELARWLTNRHFSDAWRVRQDREEREARGETMKNFYGARILAHEVNCRTLLGSPSFYHSNLSDMEGAQRLVNKIVRLDRLPPSNPLQGLLLLRSAWRDYDVAMLLAGRYKLACKCIFAFQLLVSWVVVVGTGTYAENVSEGRNAHAVFGLAVLFSILVSLDGMLNPKARWRQLRSSSVFLQSIIWQYRTRTGDFEVDENRSDFSRPENQLCEALNEWRDELLAGAALKTSNLKQKHPPDVYRHFQYNGTFVGDSSVRDDFYSPTQPTAYIKLRIEPILEFYTGRIPKYTNHGFALKVTILLLGVISSVLARYEILSWVMAATAAATIVTSWAEFSEDARKVERYSSAVNALEKLLAWWEALGEVEKASRESITHLVLKSESIISEEHRSWTSAANKQKGTVESEDGTDAHITQRNTSPEVAV